MESIKNLFGTSNSSFQIGMTGPTIYTGDSDPSSTPPVPATGHALTNGDLYIRTHTGAEAIWTYQSGSWYALPSGRNGGTFHNDVRIEGDLTVVGSLTTVGTVDLTVSDPVITVNDGETGSGVTVGYAGIEVDRGLVAKTKWLWDEAQKFWGPTGPGGTLNLSVGGTIYSGTQVLVASGTAGVPGLGFSSETTSGLYRVGLNQIGISVGGSQKLLIQSSATGADVVVTGTAAVTISSGTTLQRPSSPTIGMIRINSTSSPDSLEWYSAEGTTWYTALDTTTAASTYVPQTRTISPGTGLTGGGDLSANRTLSLAAIADGRLLANTSGSSAAPIATTPSTLIDVIGSTRGSTLYRGASGWAALVPGTNKYALVSNGAGADPSYQQISLTAGVTGTLPVLNGGTGTTTSTGTAGDVVLSISPTITGHMTVEGVTATGATGTGKFVFDASPTITGTLSATNVAASGLVSTQMGIGLRIGNAGSNAGAGLLIAGSSTNKNWFIGNQYTVGDTLEFTQTTVVGGTTPGTTIAYGMTASAFYPGTDNSATLGGASYRWSTIYGNAISATSMTVSSLTVSTAMVAPLTVGSVSGTNNPSGLLVVGPRGNPASSGSVADGIARFSYSTSTQALDIGVTATPSTLTSWIQSRNPGNYATNYDLWLNPNGGNVSIGYTSTQSATFAVNGTSAFSSTINVGSVVNLNSNVIAAVGKIGSYEQSSASSVILALNATSTASYIDTTGTGVRNGQDIIFRYNDLTEIGRIKTTGAWVVPTSVAIGGATIGSNALAWSGTAQGSGTLTISNGNIAIVSGKYFQWTNFANISSQSANTINVENWANTGGVRLDVNTADTLKILQQAGGTSSIVQAGTLALGGATIGSNALAVTGTGTISGNWNIGSGSSLGFGTNNGDGILGATSGAFLFRASGSIGGVINVATDSTFKFFARDGSSGAIIDVSGSGSALIGSATIGQIFATSGNGGTILFRNAAQTSSVQLNFNTNGTLKLFQSDGTTQAALQSGTLALGGATIGSNALAVTGDATFNSKIIMSSNVIRGSSATQMNLLTDGNVTFFDNAGTSFGLMKFGGTTSSFPAIKRSGTSLDIRLADDSAYTYASMSTLVTVSGTSAGVQWNASSDGVAKLTNFAGTDFTRLQFGGTTSSFPALKRSSTALQARLADDSGYAPVAAASLALNGASIGSYAFSAVGNLYAIGTIEDTVTADFAVYDATIGSNTTHYRSGIRGKASVVSINAGFTDSGYRVGVYAEGFMDTANFAGTLATQMAVWARHGANVSTAGSAITNSYGVYIESLTTANTTISNLWGLYQSTSSAKNYFSGAVGIGTSSVGAAGSLTVNTTINTTNFSPAISDTYFGYGSTYKVLRIGTLAANRAVALMVDPASVAGGNFPGTNQVLLPYDFNFSMANSGGTDWTSFLRANATGVFIGTAQASGQVNTSVSPYFDSAGDLNFQGTHGINLATTGWYRWNGDTYLHRDAAGYIAQRNGTNAQTLRVYNTYTDSSNYERGALDWNASSNVLTIGAQSAGTGTLRNVTYVGASHTWSVSGTGSVYIDTGGRLLVGTSSNTQSSTEKFEVYGGMTLLDYNDNSVATVYIRNRSTTAATIQPYIYFNDNTGNRGGFGVQNDDSSVHMYGHASINFRVGASGLSAARQVQISGSNSAVNYLTLSGAITANPPTIAIAGSDTNISLNLTPKGTGAVQIANSGGAAGTALKVTGSIQMVNITNGSDVFQMRNAANGVIMQAYVDATDYHIATGGNGNITLDPGGTGKLILHSGTAIPAGGTAGKGYLFSSTSNFGVFFGSGAPTLSAAQGSLYLRSDGAPYYNNNGTTGWTSMAAGTGTVTSVDVSVAGGLAVSGNPITTNGTLALSIGTTALTMNNAIWLQWKDSGGTARNVMNLNAGGGLEINNNAGGTGGPIIFESAGAEMVRLNGQVGQILLGGTTSSFPMIKRNSAGIDMRLADDSAYAIIGTAAITVNNSGSTTTTTYTDMTFANSGGYASGSRHVIKWTGGGGTSVGSFGMDYDGTTNTRFVMRDLYSGGVGSTELFGFGANGLLTFGGISSSNPAIKRSSTEIQFRLGDDSAYAPIYALSATFAGDIAMPIGANRTIGQTATSTHIAGNAGYVQLGINDGGGGHSGVRVNNTWGGTYSSQNVEFYTAEGGVSATTLRLRISPSGLLQFAGTTSSYPALKRSSTDIVARLADDSGDATFSAAAFKTTASNVNAQTGTTYTLVDADNGKTVTCSNASAITVTVPSGLAAGFSCVIVQIGAGQVTIAASSTTLRNKNGLKCSGQYAAAGITYLSSDTYVVTGDTST